MTTTITQLFKRMFASETAPVRQAMVESMEGRVLMSVAPLSTAAITDGTSNTVVYSAAKAGNGPNVYYTVKLEDVLISSYQ
jgi:hypothetical protein